MNYIKNTEVSIIICCYNSEHRIKSTLEHLACQNLGDLRCELILVDNNCKDNTVKTAFSVWKDCGNPFTLRVEEENIPGLSNARKKGIFSAKGNIIVFCDDDNWFEENYVFYGYHIMLSNSEIGVLGGRGIPVFEGEEPDWFSTFQGSYAVGFQSLYSGDITSRGYVWGAGYFIRRDTMLRLYSSGFTSFCTGRMANELTAGDDSEICKWHILIGKKLWFDENLIYFHFIEKNRLNKTYLQGIMDGFLKASPYLSIYDNLIFYNTLSITGKIKRKIIKLIRFIRNKQKNSRVYDNLNSNIRRALNSHKKTNLR